MRINKKGFTLVELIATIAIIGVIMAISIVGVNVYIGKSKDKANLITKSNVLNSAQKYVKEYYNDNDWRNNLYGYNSDEAITCVSIEQLKSVGYLDKNINDEEYRFVILRRNLNTKVIYNKTLAKDEDNEICNKYYILTPILTESNTYTNKIIAKYEISSGNEIRDISEIDIEVNYNNDENIVDNDNITYETSKSVPNSESNINDEKTYLSINIDNLIHITNYKIKLKITYDYKDNEEKEDKIVEMITNLSTKELKKPTIMYDKENYSKEKEVYIEYDYKNVYDINQTSTYFGYSNYNNLSNSINLNEFTECNTSNCDIFNNTNFFELYKIYKVNNNTNLLSLDTKENNTEIISSIYDGTNIVTSSKKIEKIDNNDYVCELILSDDNQKVLLNVIDYPTDRIYENIKWKYNYNEILENENKKEIEYKELGLYSASVRLDTKEEISCSIDTDPNNSNITFTVERRKNYEDNNSEIIEDFTKWYNGILDVTVEGNSNISVCVDEDNQCSPIETQTNTSAISFTDTNNYYIRAEITGSNKIKVLNLKIDNTIPNTPTFKITKLKSGETNTDNIIPVGADVTNYFKNNTWKNYWIIMKREESTDSHSGIEKYEFKCVQKDGTHSEPLTLNESYMKALDNKIYYIRTIDKAGNVGNWSDPYYVYVDTINPTLTYSLKDASGNDYSSTINGAPNWTNTQYLYLDFSESSDNFSGINFNRWGFHNYTTDQRLQLYYCGIDKEKFNSLNIKESDAYHTPTCAAYFGGSTTRGIIYEYDGVSILIIEAIDNAGNSARDIIYIYFDRVPPKTYYLQTGAKNEGYKSDFITEYKRSNNLYIFGKIKYSNWPNYEDKNYTQNELKGICNDGLGNCQYSAFKCIDGYLDYGKYSCVDSFNGGKDYTYSLPITNRYIKWDLDETNSIYENTYGNTMYAVRTIINNNITNDFNNIKHKGNLSECLNESSTNECLIRESFYEEEYSKRLNNNNLKFEKLSFEGGTDGKYVTLQRQCVDLAGNESPLFSMWYEINTTDYQYASCDEDGCYSYDGCSNYTGYYCYYDDGNCY